MNASLSNDALELIRDALYARRKIEAVRLYREAVHVGLAEAKREVDKLEAELRKATPERFDPCAGWPTNRVKLILVWHCLLVISLAIISAIALTEMAHGAPLTLARGVLLFGLVCAVGGAISAFRTQSYRWKR